MSVSVSMEFQAILDVLEIRLRKNPVSNRFVLGNYKKQDFLLNGNCDELILMITQKFYRVCDDCTFYLVRIHLLKVFV